jgi:hypothetical protein
MKKLALIFWLLSGWAVAQNVGPVNLTGSQCITSVFATSQNLVITVTGTWSGILQPQVMAQFATNTAVTPIGLTSPTPNIRENGIYTINVTGPNQFQVCAQSISGTATVTFAAAAQTTVTGSISGTQCLSLNSYIPGLVLITISGSWSGAIQSYVSYNQPGTVNQIGVSSPQKTVIYNGTYTTYLTTPNVLQFCGATISGTATITMTSAEPANTNPFLASGDLSGTFNSQEVVGVLNNPLPSIAPGCLDWSGSAWVFITCGGSGSLPASAPFLATNGSSVGIAAPLQQGYQVTGSSSNLATAQPKPVYDVRDWGLACNGSTNDTAAMVSLRTAIGSSAATIAIPKDSTHAGPCELGGITIPASLDFSGGGSVGLIANPASPGQAALVQAAPGTAYTGNSCSVTFSSAPTAGNAILMELVYEFGSGTVPNTPTDSGNDAFNLLVESNLGFQSNSASWGAAYIAGGSASQTVTATLAGASTHGVCFAQEVSGLGTGIVVDASNFGYASGTTPYSGPMTATATVQSGDFVIAYGGQGTNNITCSSPTLTQPASTAGNVNGSCLQYENVSSAGSLTASQTISSTTTDYWVYSVVGVRPGASTLHVFGGIIDPDLHQIFFNATGASGAVSFFNNDALNRVYPEWWGASPSASGATNAPAIQAAIVGSFGNGGTAYNKTLDLGRGIYNINAETQWYNVTGNEASRFEVDCGSAGGINQQTSNLRIMDGQSVAYGRFDNCAWSSSATDSVATADLDIDWNGTTTPTALKPQFLDFYSNSFVGNSLRDVGFLLGKSGGAAQGSNVYCWDCEFNGFTGAGFQIGGNNTGRNVGRFYAQNAIENGLWGGDMQGNNLYGVAVYGGNVQIHDTSMENGFTTQALSGSGESASKVGYDLYCEGNQGPCIMDNVRSESRKLVACESCAVKNSYTINQAQSVTPGSGDPVNFIMQGSTVAWDGQYYQVTQDGTGGWGGVGTQAGPLTASSGSSTTLVDTNQTVAGSVTKGTFVSSETVTQASTGSTVTLLGIPSSIGTITGSVTSGTIGASDTMTQASTSVTCVAQNSPTGSASLTCNAFSGTPDGTHAWTDGTTSGVYTPNSTPTFSATSMLITAATGSPNGTNNWTGGTSGAVLAPTGAPTNQANWTSNAFVGMFATVTSGTNGGCYSLITANTATTITASAGWLTKYYGLLCSSPASASTFIVEPAWGSSSILYSCAAGSTSGACGENGIIVTNMGEDMIGSASGETGAVVTLDNVTAPGGKLFVSSRYSLLAQVDVTRPDWFNNTGANSGPDTNNQNTTDLDIVNVGQVYTSGGGAYYQNQTFGTNGAGDAVTLPLQRRVGTSAFVWGCAVAGGGPACKEVGIGGRSTPISGDNHLEIFAGGGSPVIFGPPAPFGTNIAGINNEFSCGRSSGSATGGTCQFLTSAAGSSGSSINSETVEMSIAPSGVTVNLGGQTVVNSPISLHGTCEGTLTSASSNAGAVDGLGGNVNNGACSGGGGAFVKWGTVITHACNLQNLYVNLGTGGLSSGDVAVTVQDGGTATNLTCTAGTGTVCHDTTSAHNFSASAGDMVWVKTVTVGAVETASDQSVSIDCQ